MEKLNNYELLSCEGGAVINTLLTILATSLKKLANIIYVVKGRLS